ncbi:hypothetical protein ACELLULO517_03110 [Acidisoma cellulosilytica]|uniref:Uncharacterized protein n=1 Tax=Acidisoma cellulosilyticum TaxID=2802395 RepID=A0A964E2A2_9PROT|nr:hypothetical protein [Acidisoma cellulosilyticum]MCB8879211.1 hypothetical protein [Acidisoma cellulosilyticum]
MPDTPSVFSAPKAFKALERRKTARVALQQFGFSPVSNSIQGFCAAHNNLLSEQMLPQIARHLRFTV